MSITGFLREKKDPGGKPVLPASTSSAENSKAKADSVKPWYHSDPYDKTVGKGIRVTAEKDCLQEDMEYLVTAWEVDVELVETSLVLHSLDPIPDNNIVSISGDRITVELGGYAWSSHTQSKKDTRIQRDAALSRSAAVIQGKAVSEADGDVRYQITKLPSEITGREQTQSVEETGDGYRTAISTSNRTPRSAAENGSITVRYRNGELKEVEAALCGEADQRYTIQYDDVDNNQTVNKNFNSQFLLQP